MDHGRLSWMKSTLSVIYLKPSYHPFQELHTIVKKFDPSEVVTIVMTVSIEYSAIRHT